MNAQTGDSPILSVRSASRTYRMGEMDVRALREASLDIHEGEFLIIVGPSGSGKTTLLNLVGGMDRPTSGEVLFLDTNLAAASDRALTFYRRTQVGFIFQFYNLIPTLTTLENVQVAVELMPKLIDQYIGRKTLEEKVLAQQLAQARARLVQAEHELKLAQVRSPITGVVLERHEQGNRSLPAGQTLLLLGNIDHLETIADVLTEDALKLSPGSEVSLEPAAGTGALAGKVKRIEPAGFTKLSSLGVEQQRVNVIVAFNEKPAKLGVGYRLQARFFTGSRTDALILPRFAVMQSPDGDFYVFVAEAGVLRKQPVRLGLTSDLDLEITHGLTGQHLVVTHPDATMKEGMKVKAVMER